MRFLIFLLIGTLIFGVAFPAAILLVGFVGVMIFGFIIAGLLRGGGVKVYTFGAGRRSGREGSDMTGQSRHNSCDDFQVYDPEDSEEGEVIELPASALRKEDD